MKKAILKLEKEIVFLQVEINNLKECCFDNESIKTSIIRLKVEEKQQRVNALRYAINVLSEAERD